MWPFTRRARVAPAPYNGPNAAFVGESNSGNVPMSRNNAKLSRKRWRTRATDAEIGHLLNKELNKNAKNGMRNFHSLEARKNGVIDNVMMNLRGSNNKSRKARNNLLAIRNNLRGPLPNYKRNIAIMKMQARLKNKKRHNQTSKMIKNHLNAAGYNQNYRNSWTRSFNKE